MSEFYTTYSDYLARLFPGRKVQKITVDAGFTCPNRDGKLGNGGCIYCNNATFSPDTGRSAGSIAEKIEAGKAFFARKYPTMTYLVYFQSYTNTYDNTDYLVRIFSEAMDMQDIEGIVIGTRPDCMPAELLNELVALNRWKPVIIEYGAETFNDDTLRIINRNHSAACIEETVVRTADAGLSCGIHLIMGLPGETQEEMMTSVHKSAQLPIDSIKFHQLQVIKDTELHRRYMGNVNPAPTIFTVEEYIDLCVEIVKAIPKRIAIDRFVSQAPRNMLVAPCWGIKNYEFAAMLETRLRSERYK